MFKQSLKMRSVLGAMTIIAFASALHAHVDWTRVNAPDPDLLGLYHFDSHNHDAGQYFEADTCDPSGRSLLIGTPSGLGFQTPHSTVEPIFDPHSLRMRGPQSAESDFNLHGLDGDLTLECWFKWETGLTSSSFEIGLRSGAKLTLTRHVGTPANDRFGINGTHGDYRSAPGFVNWPTVELGGEGEIDEWHHVGVTIHSTGQEFNAGLGHDVYSAGSVARFYLNGHAVGAHPHTVDISGLQVHDHSRLRIRNIAGSVMIDEVTFWKKDWSNNGAVSNPFSDGRGSEMCKPDWTRTNESSPYNIGLYQFDGHEHLQGEFIQSAPCQPDEHDLLIEAPGGLGMDTAHDTPEAIFDPHSMHFQGPQNARTTANLSHDLGGDLTIETWFKWDNALTSSSIEIGLQSGAKLKIVRDVANPANDRFGIQGTHGDYRSAPGFVNWPAVGPSAAPLGEWCHAALTIDSLGIIPAPGHDIYTTGTLATMFLNNRPLGPEPYAFDLGSLKVHDHSRVRIQNFIGDIYVDEVTVWKQDWTNAGADLAPFSDGRGDGSCNSIRGDWSLYE